MKYLFIVIVLCSQASITQAQEMTLVLDTSLFEGSQAIWLADTGNWVFKEGSDIKWADPAFNTQDWDTLRPGQIKTEMADEDGRLEGWFRLKLKLDSSFSGMDVGMIQRVWASTDVFLDGELIRSFGNTGLYGAEYSSYDRDVKNPTTLPLIPGQEHLIAIHVVDEVAPLFGTLKSEVQVLHGFFNITSPDYTYEIIKSRLENQPRWIAILSISGILLLLSWLIYIFNQKEKHILFIAISITITVAGILPNVIDQSTSIPFGLQQLYDYLNSYLFIAVVVIYPLALGQIFKNKISKTHWIVSIAALVCWNVLQFRGGGTMAMIVGPATILSGFGFTLYYLISSWKTLKGAKWAIVIGIILPTFTLILILTAVILDDLVGTSLGTTQIGQIIAFLFFMAFPLSLLVYISLWFKQMMDEAKTKSQNLLRLSEEKKEILSNQKQELEREVELRTSELKSSQAQLIHSEKMASLGELTAGIAHEIQNPLNFVNNFSDLNQELLDDLKEAIAQNDQEEIEAIYVDLKDNEAKINHHGKRAEEIVKSMLQHSRGGDGEKELIDLNALADEYLRLSYHGLRAKDKSFNAEFKTDLDPELPKVNVVPQDIGRVLLNLINNAFQAVKEVKQPEVIVSTRLKDKQVEILVKDNGPGIPDEIKDKIFQPFFTTKATGEGTGLGLSMSYDIVTKGHEGTLKVQSNGNGTVFTVSLKPGQ